MTAGALHQMASLRTLAAVMGPSIAGTVGFFIWYRKVYGWTRTMNEEWYAAEEAYMNAVPRQGSSRPVRINPFSGDSLTMHLTRS